MGASLLLIYQMVVYRGKVTSVLLTKGNQEVQLHKARDKLGNTAP
jgi:phage gp45-like